MSARYITGCVAGLLVALAVNLGSLYAVWGDGVPPLWWWPIPFAVGFGFGAIGAMLGTAWERAAA